MNIPYFYHLPGKEDLFDSNNYCYKDAFSYSAVSNIQARFRERSEEKKQMNCKIIKANLGLRSELIPIS